MEQFDAAVEIDAAMPPLPLLYYHTPPRFVTVIWSKSDTAVEIDVAVPPLPLFYYHTHSLTTAALLSYSS